MEFRGGFILLPFSGDPVRRFEFEAPGSPEMSEAAPAVKAGAASTLKNAGTTHTVEGSSARAKAT
ncbi:hypothetical protein, partial [Streptomyces sp. NPDC052693]|uniref:hypothetical protein n=1 Tax=Streptomyces sp. NPDC052693 TaxID=3155814 RepID=UPI00341663ED